MKTIIKTFNSGLRLAFMQRQNVRSVAICILCGVGSQNETTKNNGISHFIEHTVFKGTKTRSSFDIVNEIEAIGALTNAFTSKENTCFYTYSVASDVDKCAEILSDILFNATFEEKELESEKKVICEEISMSEDDNMGVCFDLLAEGYFGKDSPFGRDIIGTVDNVKGFTKQDIQEYMKENYCAKDVVITICGSITLEKATELIEKYFEGKFSDKKDRIWRQPKLVTNQVYVHKFKDIEQANICIGMNGECKFGKPLLASKVAHEIFGGGMSSRLFQEVREKHGLAYSTYAAGGGYANNGTTEIYIGTNINSAAKAVELTRDLINDVKKNGFTKEEVEKGKNAIKSALIFSNEGNMGIMRQMSKFALNYDYAFDVDEFVNIVENLTVDDVNQAFNKCYDISTASISYVGREIKDNLLDVFTK